MFSYFAIGLIMISAVFAGIQPTKNKDGSELEQQNRSIEIDDQFKNVLEEKGYIINAPEMIKKPELVDKIKRIKSLFGDQNAIFFY